ncbi:MAG: RcpC/CpaB family pilus assembly protein [Acidimicrobiales bacterium]|nr:RcpC/CpaB family pilus assembly protein [Acidimicrobiales bacterium]
MSSRRTLILLGAIAIGVVAALLLFNYVRGIEDRFEEGAKKVTVFQASGEVKRGVDGAEALKSNNIVQKQIPNTYAPTNAIRTADQIDKKVALFDIAPGTIIVDGMFVDRATTVITFRNRIKQKENVAIAISVDPVKGVGSYLVPGDEVNMMVLQEIQFESGQGQGAQNPCALPQEVQQRGGGPFCLKQVARMLYQKVEILAVGQNVKLEPGETTDATNRTGSNTTSSSGGTANSGLIVLNVPPEAAMWIATFSAQGQGIYLALTADGYTPTVVREVPPVPSVLPGEDSAIITPYGPNGITEK